MRTTLSIDDDMLRVAKDLAHARSEPIGKVVSDLMRKGVAATPQIKIAMRNGFPVFQTPSGARPITIEDVKRLEDEW